MNGRNPSEVKPDRCDHEIHENTGRTIQGIRSVLWNGQDMGYVSMPIYRCIACGQLHFRIIPIQNDVQIELKAFLELVPNHSTYTDIESKRGE